MSENDNQENPNKRKGRKKRKNFLSNAKKYAKKGQMGRGTKMSEELYQYFVGILDVMKAGMEDEEERQALVNNVLERTKDEEINIIGNQLGCRVIELLLPFSNAEDLERFMEAISPELRRLCSDNFSSHVVETLLRVACDRAVEKLQDSDEEPKAKKKKSKEKFTETHIETCLNFTLKISKYCLNNLEDFVWDSYANHILRSTLKCLSGLTALPGEKPKTNIFVIPSKTNKGIAPHENVPPEFHKLVKEFSKRLSSWPQFKDLPYQNLTSGLLQVLIFAVNNVEKKLSKELIQTLLNDSFAPDGWLGDGTDEKKDKDMVLDDTSDSPLPPVFGNESAVRLLEVCLFVAKKKLYTQLYAKCFINRLAQLATMKTLNYTVQRLFDNCQIKEELEPMFDELADKFDQILAAGNTGVLLAIAKACQRVKTKQTQFINSLESSLKCDSQENQKWLPIACLRLTPLDKIDVNKLEREYFINVHGSVILQSLLDFQRPTKAVNGLLELSPEQLLIILCDTKGCHVTDAFFKGQFVGVKSRDKMLWKLRGYYQRLALSQYGSRAFEQIFSAATIEQKIKIMSEISDKSNLLNSSNYGRLIATKLNVELFKKSQDNWKKMYEKQSNKSD